MGAVPTAGAAVTRSTDRVPVLAERRDEREMRAVAHELKTPLAIVFGYAQTLLQQDLPEDSRRWFLKVIADQSRRLLRAIDRMEELNRLDDGVDSELVDVTAVARGAAQRAQESVPGARIEGVFDPVGQILAWGSRAWLDLAFEEALVACVAAVGDGGTVEVAFEPSDGASVRVYLDTAPPAEPRGLGVYLARRILAVLGGTLDEERGRLTFGLRAP